MGSRLNTDRGGSGARVSGCCAEELKRRIEWSRAAEAQEHEIRGPEGVLGPCHGGGELSAGRRSGRRGARGKGPAGEGEGGGWRPSDAWEGGSRRWSGSGLHSSSGEVLCTGGSEEQGSRGVPEEEERRGGPKGLCGNIKNLRDPTVK
jgi:hypothetical protein